MEADQPSPERDPALEAEALDGRPEALGHEAPTDPDALLEEGPVADEVPAPEDGRSPDRDRELEDELLPAQLEEVSLLEREPVRIASLAAAAVALCGAAVGLRVRSPWAAGYAAAAAATAIAGELARRRVTPVAAPDLPD